MTNKEVKALKWNGREIRKGKYYQLNCLILHAENGTAFQVAVNIAQAEDIRDPKKDIVVKRHHVGVTVSLSSDFKDCMKSVRKKGESERACLAGNRDDS